MRGGKDTPLRTPVAFGEVLGRYSAQPEQGVKITSVKRRKSGTAFLQNTRDFFFVVARDFFHSRATLSGLGNQKEIGCKSTQSQNLIRPCAERAVPSLTRDESKEADFLHKIE